MDQSSFHSLGKMLLLVGGILVVLGIIVILGWKIPFLGKLPGDISIRKAGMSVYFPIATCILLSVVLTVIVNLFFRK